MDLLNSIGDTIPSRFLANVQKHAGSIALRARRDDGTYRTWTYRQYADDVARCAAGLRALGFGAGQRLVLMLRNRPEFHILDMAVNFCGGTAVSIYNSSAPEQVAYLLQHSEATIAIADDHAFLDRFLSIKGTAPALRGGAIDGTAPALPALRHLGVMGGDAPSGVFGWEALLDHAPIDLHEAAHAAEPDGLCTLIYTSGTTGPPKAVMLTHHNVVWTVAAMQQTFAEHPRLREGFAGVRVISYLPLAHIAERMCSHYMPALLGHEVTCCPDATQIGVYLREVKPHVVFGVPRVWEKLHAGVQAAVSADPSRARKLEEAVLAAVPLVEKLQNGHASQEERDLYRFLDQFAFKNLRALIGLDEVILAITGAAPTPRALQSWFRAIGVPLSDCYGMSETCGPMTWSPFTTKPGTVGKPLPGVEVALASDGEIICRGPNVFRGYYKAPEQTAETIDADGWLHSGDIGAIDEDGYFRVVDRKKELIITAGGKNISPANLEAALKSIPLVGQACAIGDDRAFVTALIVLDPDVAKAWAARRGVPQATLADLALNAALIAEIEAGIERAMASFNRAEKVKRFKVLGTDWLPDSEELTPTSKLKRRAIHAKYKAEIEGLYASTLAPPTHASERAQTASKKHNGHQ